MEDTAKTRKAVNLRLDPELYDQLKAFADRTERSANGAAVFAIRSFLDQQGGDVVHFTAPPTHTR